MKKGVGVQGCDVEECRDVGVSGAGVWGCRGVGVWCGSGGV